MNFTPLTRDQFASLTATTRTLEPERFTNQELGAKWEVRPNLMLTAALFRLDRTNTAAPDPADPARLVRLRQLQASPPSLARPPLQQPG